MARISEAFRRPAAKDAPRRQCFRHRQLASTPLVTFHSITQGGYTTFSVIEIPSAAGTPPEGYTISADTFDSNITSTATYTTLITVAFTLPYDTSEADFDRIRILHLENGELVDRTILPPDDPSPNFETRTVYAEVDSLSPFVVAMAPNPPTLLNISTRANVLTGDNVLIGGFIVTGNAPKKVLLRAIGPSLTPFGVSDALADPVLELHKPDGTVVTNDNWKDTQESEIEATNIAPSSNLESAILVTLDPVDPAVPGSGAYTAIVKGTNDGTGVAWSKLTIRMKEPFAVGQHQYPRLRAGRRQRDDRWGDYRQHERRAGAGHRAGVDAVWDLQRARGHDA